VYGSRQRDIRFANGDIMDLGKLSKGGKIFAAGALLYLISSFLTWYSIDFMGISVTANGWDVGFGWGRLWAILLIVGAVLLLLPAAGVSAPSLQPAVYLIVGALSFIFTLLRLLIGYDGLDSGFGLYLAVVAAAGAAYGAFADFTAAGGKLGDLADSNSLKKALGVEQSGTTPPPPPPAD
jgi:hypothetical protein